MADNVVKIPPTIAVREFAERLQLPATSVAAELIKNGIMASINEEIDFDTASIIAEDLGRKVELDTDEAEVEATGQTIEEYLREEDGAKLIARPPVVAVMGHVDHGKTSLLDTIRQTKVTDGEAGGITQHIGAYQITEHDRLITFIDTPGHEAFTQMRARGAKIADVAVLVVAADDGVKPQTVETLRIINEAKLPYIVAITKIDKPDANPERVKKELSEKEVLSEEWGGKVPFVNVSSKTKEGLTDLLDAVLLLADVDSKNLMVNPNRPAIGTIIESHVDPKQGAVASVLVQTGTLKVGDDIIVGQVYGKVRSLKNDRGEMLKSAPPSLPVQILGLKVAPQVGDILRVSADDVQDLKKKVKSHQMTHHFRSVVGRTPTPKPAGGAEGDEEKEKKPELKKHLIILKTDTLGSAEAILESLKKIQHEEVSVQIVQRGLGIISEADILRAEAAKATVYGFHVQTSPKAEQLARGKGIEIKAYDVIYDLINDIIAKLEAMLPPLVERQETGKLNVLAIFRNENTFQVVGGKVADGSIVLGNEVEVRRGGETISSGKITQLQSNKQNTKEVTAGNECGMKVEGKPIIQVGDALIAITSISTPRKLNVS